MVGKKKCFIFSKLFDHEDRPKSNAEFKRQCIYYPHIKEDGLIFVYCGNRRGVRKLDPTVYYYSHAFIYEMNSI